MSDPTPQKNRPTANGGHGMQQQELVRLLGILKTAIDSLSSNTESALIPSIIAYKMTELLGADGCVIRQWNQRRGVLKFIHGTGSGKWVSEREMYNLKLGETPYADIFTTREPQIFQGQQGLNPKLSNWLKSYQVKSLVVFPLVSSGKNFGLIEIYFIKNKGIEKEILLIGEIFAGHAAAALENQTTHDHIKQVKESRLQLEEKLRHDALHDPLTNISNRVMFENSLEQAILRKRRNDNYNFMVFCIDLDRFAEVNESYGYPVGDHLLQTIANRLNSGVREVDIVARFNSDTFMILVEGMIDENTIAGLVERINSILADPIEVNNDRIIISGTIGVAVASNTRTTSGDYIHDATAAMQSAKSDPNAQYKVFTNQLLQEEKNRLEIEKDFRKAIANREFVMYYQPIVSLVDGSLKGMESLARWEKPGRGMVYPTEFIPQAEQTGMIIDIGYLLLDQVCSALAKWQQINGMMNSKILSINISGKQLTQPGFIKRVNATLDKYDLDPRNLVFEVTESIFIKKMESVYLSLVKLNELGIRVYLDDFGTGYSSLSYLNELPVQAIKLNQTFISTINNNKKQETLVSTIILMARKIGLEVIAEGIEEKEQADCLKNLGCLAGQGYLYSKPLPYIKMDKMLLSKNK